MKKLSQNGFTAIGALLILAMVAIIGGVGWYVTKSKNGTNKTYDNASKSYTTASPESTAYKFSELDVQLTLPKTLRGLTYKVEELPDENGRTVEVLYLYNPNLSTLAKKCSAF